MQYKKSLNIYIVEEIGLTQVMLANSVKSYGHVVVGSNEKANRAFLPITNLPVDLVLLEIDLQGGDEGIKLANQIKENLSIPLIYLTTNDDCGFMERLMSTDPSGYMINPYNNCALQATIRIAYAKFTQLNHGLNLNDAMPSKINYVLVSEGPLKVKLPFDQVLFIESDGNYVEYHTKNIVYRERSKLKEVEEIVSFHSFVRINKGLLVNLSKATGFNKDQIFIGNLSFPVSRLHRKNIKDYFRL